MHRWFAAAVLCCGLIVIWGCSGQAPPATDQEQTEQPAATDEATGEVFEDGFEEGGTDEWGQDQEPAQDEPDAQADDEEPSPSQPPSPSQ